MKKNQIFLILSLFFGFVVFLKSTPAFAKNENLIHQDWSGELLTPIEPFIMKSGEQKMITVEFRNTGTKTWKRINEHFAALNVTNPTGRKSAFKDKTWLESYRPTKLAQSSVRPKKIARFQFMIEAPNKPGTYTESFGLVAERLTWISGGDVTLTIHVTQSDEKKAAILLNQSFHSIESQPGQSIPLMIEFQNIGVEQVGSPRDPFVLQSKNSYGRANAHGFPETIAAFSASRPSLRSGERGSASFLFNAPEIPGKHREAFQLLSSGARLGPVITIEIQVRGPRTALRDNSPLIRVGLFETTSLSLIPRDSRAVIESAQAIVQAIIEQDEKVTITKGDDHYTVTSEHFSKSFHHSPKIKTIDQQGVLEISTIKKNNLYRGSLEIKTTVALGKTWTINELPIETYVKGVEETSEPNPKEFLKALIIAERTYANYHRLKNTKHDEENFHVDATFDQVYTGASFEKQSPEISDLVDETRGVVVSYQGDLALTPYFSHSDGRTRAWEEVWAGDEFPWLISKDDPCCKTKKLHGHGVGMSALGARWFASNKGWSADQILQHYYTGTGLKKLY